MKLTRILHLCVGREYGSGGRAISEVLGDILDIPVYDVNILSELAEKEGLDKDVLKSEDEKLASPFFSNYITYHAGETMLSDRIFNMQADLIREKAAEGSAIFVGRCADEILREDPDMHSIYIYAPIEDRIHRAMERENLSRADAEKFVRRMDKQRRSYYQFYTDKKWGSTEGRDLLLNSAVLGIGGTARFLADYLVHLGFVEK